MDQHLKQKVEAVEGMLGGLGTKRDARWTAKVLLYFRAPEAYSAFTPSRSVLRAGPVAVGTACRQARGCEGLDRVPHPSWPWQAEEHLSHQDENGVRRRSRPRW
jgi:hypothetical protein